jgi:hypothetical protein
MIKKISEKISFSVDAMLNDIAFGFLFLPFFVNVAAQGCVWRVLR